MDALCCFVVYRHFAFPRKRFPEFLADLHWRPQRAMGLLDTSFTIYDVKWECGRSRVQTGIWNVLCTASNSNFWTQRAFCSSANKSLWAAFSDTAENRSPLVGEVRIKVFLKAATVRAVRAPQIDLQNFNIFTLWSCLLGSLSCNRK